MKILFTILCVNSNQKIYLDYGKNLVNEILSLTNHDVLLTTNDVDFYSDIINPRFTVRNNLTENLILRYSSGAEFNYNLKFLAFKDIPTKYDAIFYLDCDVKLINWTTRADDLLDEILSEYDFIATRLNCVLRNEMSQLNDTGNCLFRHKVLSYNINSYDKDDKIFNSALPSEHYFILKNDPERVKMFYERWSQLNDELQKLNGGNGSWGDGFEIGLSANYANFNKILNQGYSTFEVDFGMLFNGNKT